MVLSGVQRVETLVAPIGMKVALNGTTQLRKELNVDRTQENNGLHSCGARAK